MVLYKRGTEKYFDNDLLTCLREKKNDEVRRFLKEQQSNESSLTVYRTRDSSQATLLHYAAEYGNEDIVKELIDSDSEIDAQDQFGRSPLMLALMGEHEMVIQVLLKANANIKLTDVQGKSAFQMIVEMKTVSSEIFNILVQHVLLDNIVKSMTSDVLVQKLRKNGITLNQAALLGNVQFLKLLLDQDYTVDEKDSKNGKTALHTAVEMHDSEMVKALVEYGANVDALDASKSIPLRYLHPCGIDSEGSSEFLEILTVLLDRTTLLTSSSNEGWMQISNILIFGCEEAVKLILQKIVDLHIIDDKGNSVVHYMAWNEDTRVIELLRGREFNVNAVNKAGYTPLHWAAGEHSTHAVQFLLENKADVHVRGFSDDTPLRRLFKILNTSKLDDAMKCIRLLLEHGSDPFDNVDDVFDLVLQLHTETAETIDGEVNESKKILTLIEPILAQMAVSKARGVEVSELVLSKIQLQSSWVEYFNMCQKQVDRMSKTTIYGNVTLLRFFQDSKKKITAYVRNEELVSELERIINEFETNSPYLDLIQKRLAEAIRLAELKKNAIAAIYRLIDLKDNAHYFSAEYIADYLSNDDMENLNLVMQF